MTEVFEERRRGYVELAESYQSLLKGYEKLQSTVHTHDTEIAVLRAQLQADSGRISLLEKAVEKIFERLDEVKSLISAGRDILAGRTEQEDKDRIKLMRGVIATLVSVLLSAGGFLVTHLLSK